MPPGEGVLGEQGLVRMYHMLRGDCENVNREMPAFG
jgi:hypothetical protein